MRGELVPPRDWKIIVYNMCILCSWFSHVFELALLLQLQSADVQLFCLYVVVLFSFQAIVLSMQIKKTCTNSKQVYIDFAAFIAHIGV